MDMRSLPNNEDIIAELKSLGYEERNGSAAYEREFITVVDKKKWFWLDNINHNTRGNTNIFEYKFLDYILRDTYNGDGIVLKKEKKASGYECHLGNYGKCEGQGSIDLAKRAAVIFFMLARPEIFATTVFYRLMGNGGQYHEWFLLRRALLEEGIDMPDELSKPIGGLNHQIGYMGKSIFIKSKEKV
jgi:hypothetical protein